MKRNLHSHRYHRYYTCWFHYADYHCVCLHINYKLYLFILQNPPKHLAEDEIENSMTENKIEQWMNKHRMKRYLIIIIPHGICLDLRTYCIHSCTIFFSLLSETRWKRFLPKLWFFFFSTIIAIENNHFNKAAFYSQFVVEMQQNCSFKEPACVQSRTATPVNLLLGGGQEVEGINTIESTQSMRGREDWDKEIEQGGWQRCRLGEEGSWVTINQRDKKATGAFD